MSPNRHARRSTLAFTMPMRLAISAIGLLVIFAIAACGSETSPPTPKTLELRIYDGSDAGTPPLTAADIIRSSARTEPGDTAESSLLSFRLSRRGVRRFHDLTRRLARRGRRTHHPQRFVLEINHKVYARPSVDYRVFPDGLDASQGLQVAGLRQSIARRLAAEIRGDS